MISKRHYLVFASLLLLAGCSSQLATGYQPRKLGASEAVRRTYYASPYSPQSHPEAYGSDGPAIPPG